MSGKVEESVPAPAREESRSSSPREEGNSGLTKGLAVLECFSRSQPRLTVSQAASLTAVTPAAARRCLRALSDLGYVSFDGKFYRPTPRVTRLATAYTETDPLPRLVQPLLEELRDETNESCSLVVMDDEHALFVARAESTHVVSTGFSIGARLPLHSSAAGRALLTGFDEPELEQFLRKVRLQPSTPQSLTTVAAIRARIQRAREDGFAISDEEIELGLRAIAAPVVDPDGRTVASITISALAARTPVEVLATDFLPRLKDKVERLGRML